MRANAPQELDDNSLFDREFETLSPDDLRKYQETRWASQWEYVKKHSRFYQTKLAQYIDRDISLDDLQDLPLTEKDELRISQEADYPFGNYIACPEERVARMHRTSGTTGRPLILSNSQKDAEKVAHVGARSMWAAGLRPRDRVVHCLNYCMWTGGFTDHTILEASGATVLPFGVGNTTQLIQSIKDLGITAISCTPSYPAMLEKVLRDHFPGLSPRDLGLRLGLFGGEGGLDNPAFREAMEEKWGFKVRNANFGLSEVLSILGGQTSWTNDLLFHAGDVIFAEILDPESGKRLPINEGTVGELVCTHLAKECQPLIRYRTRDIVTVTGADAGPDGRTAWRFRVTGRTDDMFNVRGINVFPSAVRAAVEALPQYSSGQFRIVLRGPGPYDRIDVKVEAAQLLSSGDWNGAREALEREIQRRIGSTAVVEMIPFEGLPRTDGKTKWVEQVEV
ncbi:phenylacetate--CoA ligase family protein [Noviherbaspirillum saxi]|uniref:Phenylacetate--CoA ligase family protein n=1 Tax=Noviherbaspirillum saxi TaxID=2320863 RepID=A0A3A3FJP4_9BURK|nr:AMP-binding protein [Noviherbaspirillum saxi]RJF95517.1 phenylacetate--CoA ligase family protein [Noviherbaspirillum saxi]